MCGNKNLVPVVDLGNQCLTGVFPASREQKITLGPLKLVKCVGAGGSSLCSLVQLGHTYSKSEMYGENYGYHSSLNSSMVTHLQGIASFCLHLARPKPGEAIVDIGSNDGTLLNMYPDSLTLIGIDPTIKKFHTSYKPNIEKIGDFFPGNLVARRFSRQKAKIVTSIAMFYDLDSPVDFIRHIIEILDDEGIWVSEQSYLPAMLENNSYDTICHEHLEYYSLIQLKWAFELTGLKIIDLEFNDTNGGSFRVTAAKKGSKYPEATDIIRQTLEKESQLELETTMPFIAFREKMEKHRRDLLSLLGQIKGQGKKVIGYGASTKGNVILQYCGITEKELPYIAEVNEDKFGKFTPRTLIPIISENEARAMNPDYFLVLPWHFKENLVKREGEYLSKGGKLIFPLPEIEIISK